MEAGTREIRAQGAVVLDVPCRAEMIAGCRVCGAQLPYAYTNPCAAMGGSS